jgi:microcystin degradation protein MlrC
VVVLDLHSDTTDLLIKNASITLAFNEEPHRDMFERGAEAAKLIQKIRRGEVHPTASRERPPMLLPAINMATEKGPMHELHKLRAELEATPGVIDISIHGGFYGTDSSEAGFSVVCTTDSNVNLARRQARTVAIEAWRRREEFIVPVVPIKIALKEALSAGEPVGLIDECDDPAGGGSGDSVVILRGMLDAGAKSGGISTVMDYGVARKMAEAGEGTKVTVTLGAKTDSLHGKSVDVSGRVIKLFNGPVPSDTWSGKTQNAGIVGVLDIGGILVVVTEHKIVTENIDIFNLLGFDVTKLQAIGFKGLGLHVRQALAGKIGRFIPIDGAGVTHPDVRKLGPYKRIRRPTWPLDDIPADAYPDADMS